MASTKRNAHPLFAPTRHILIKCSKNIGRKTLHVPINGEILDNTEKMLSSGK